MTDSLVNFYDLSLSLDARHQLSNICKTRQSWKLADIICKHAFHPFEGFHVPVANDVYLRGKLPDLSRAINSSHDEQASVVAVYFTNGLLIPDGYDSPAFDAKTAPAPKLRATNIGYLVATHEFDCKTREEFEQILGWTRGERSEFSRSVLFQWDRELSKFKDYRGYTVVFTGARSLHFHFIFCTKHLIHVPFDATANERHQGDWQNQSALMHNAHDAYWDIALKSLRATVEEPCPSDTKMRSLTQWRRAPWGMRVLENDAPILGLKKGTSVPQLVIREKIRTRAPKGSTDYAVAPDFNCFTRPRHHKTKNNNYDPQGMDTIGQSMLQMFREICLEEWQSEYPKPASIRVQGGQWLMNFHNHEQDKNPSTIVLGNYRKLLLAGEHSFPQEFYLPDQMTAQELGDHIYMRCGGCPQPKAEKSENIGSKHEKKDTSSRPPSPIQELVDPIINSFSNNVDITAPRDQLIETYHRRFGEIANKIRIFSNPYIIKSVEGLGKTSAHIRLLPHEALDSAIASYPDPTQRFGCFAFRSHEQALQKAMECQKAGHNAVVIRSFRAIYESVCSKQGVQPLPAYAFHDSSPTGMLADIEEQQPEIFEQLESVRKSLWEDASFNAGTTTLFMSHALAKAWNYGRMTRVWHHPEFDPWDDQCDSLRKQFTLGNVIFDERELDEFLNIFSESTHDFIKRQQRQHPGWRNITRLQRFHIFNHLKSNGEMPANMDFEQFNDVMRIDVSKLDPVDVNYDAISFGNDNTPRGIYRQEHGRRFYIGIQEWPFSNINFAYLTTESLMTEIVASIYEKKYTENNPLIRVELDDVPGIYPIAVPLYIDKRAAADRKSPKVSELAAEITASDPNAMVISNGVTGVEQVITFQKAKGQNDLKEKKYL